MNGLTLMNLLPQEFVPFIVTFASLFSKPVWESALVLLVGAILAPGKRTVSAILRVIGLHQEGDTDLKSKCDR